MALAFPQREDNLRLKRSPLAEVICQVRFPPILTIPETRPVAFQDRVRRRFPDYEVEDNVLFRVDAASGMPLPTAQQQVVNRSHKFISRKRGNTVVLAVDFFSLSSTRYKVWEEFATDLQLVSDAVVVVYDPAHATRVGLRYVNVLDPEKLGLESFAKVVDLLQPELQVLFKTEVWGEPAEAAVQLALVDEDGAGRLTFRMGKRIQDQKSSLALDFDYFQEDEEGLPLADLVERCDRYHRVIYDAFRWCIPEGNLEVFEPVLKLEAAE
jgi:uncharacterized protein (TIGR04255 family)